MTSGPEHQWQCPPRSVVAAVDFDPASARAVAIAGLIASANTATLHVLHAERFSVPPYFTLEQIARLEDERRDATAEITTELTRFVKEATAWPAAALVAEGAPVDVILAAAAQADLMVLGTHGRRGPSRWWLGSVAERVVRGAESPVLVTRADNAPLPEVFARVVLVAEGVEPDAAAQATVQRLTASLGGGVLTSAALDHCAVADLEAATLVAVAMPPGRSRWALSDIVTDTLGQCARPVLFLPSR